MPKHRRSFLIRCWDLAEGEQRIEIEHIQSGKRVVATSVASALAWICDGAAGEPLSPASETGNSPGDRATSARER